MMKKLMNHDRPIWGVTAFLYIALGALLVVFAGPLSWAVRAEDGASAGAVAVQIGVVAGALFAGGFLAALVTARPASPFVPVAVPGAGVLAGTLGAVFLEPWWLGLLALIPVSLSAVGFLARKQAAEYAKLFEEGNEESRPATVDPGRLRKGGEPDKLLTVGGSGLLAAVGVLLVVSSATVVPWMKPELPAQLQADGQIVTGEGNPVDVKVLYGINHPTSATLISGEDGTLSRLVDEGTVQLTTQGVSLSEESLLAVPVRAAEACVFEREGAEATFEFTSRYYQEFFSGDGTDNTADLIAKAGEPLGDEFTACVNSGKYEFAAGQALEESSQYAEQGFPQIFINGEEVKPETGEELARLVNEAA